MSNQKDIIELQALKNLLICYEVKPSNLIKLPWHKMDIFT